MFGSESLTARMGLNTDGYARDLKKAEGLTAKAGKRMAGMFAGFLTVGGLVALGKNAIETGSKLSDLATSARTNVEAFQVLRAVTKDAGKDEDLLAKTLQNTEKAAVDAEHGLSTYTRAFSVLGINTKDFLAMPQEKRLELLGKRYLESGKSAASYAAIQDIIGKRGAGMLEVLEKLGTDGFEKLSQQATEAGRVMSENTIMELDKAADEIEAFKDKITVAVGTILVDFKTKEGTQKLGFQLMAQAARFGGFILDKLNYAGQLAGNVMSAGFNLAADYLWRRVSDIIDDMKIKFGELMLSMAEKNPFTDKDEFFAMAKKQAELIKSVQDWKSQRGNVKSFGERLDALSGPSESNHADELSAYWTAKADAAEAAQKERIAAEKAANKEIRDDAVATADDEIEQIERVSAAREKASSAPTHSGRKPVTVHRGVSGEILNWEALTPEQRAALTGTRYAADPRRSARVAALRGEAIATTPASSVAAAGVSKAETALPSMEANIAEIRTMLDKLINPI